MHKFNFVEGISLNSKTDYIVTQNEGGEFITDVFDTTIDDPNNAYLDTWVFDNLDDAIEFGQHYC